MEVASGASGDEAAGKRLRRGRRRELGWAERRRAPPRAASWRSDGELPTGGRAYSPGGLAGGVRARERLGAEHDGDGSQRWPSAARWVGKKGRMKMEEGEGYYSESLFL
jgi:hypothetical protein